MSSTPTSRPPSRPSTRSAGGRRLALAGLSLGYFMVLFDTTALTVALPDVARALGGGVEGLAWVTDAYTVTFAASLLAGGVLADRRGAVSTFRIGLVGFGLLSLLCAAAPTVAALATGRALLGFAGGLLLPASLWLVANLDPDRASRTGAVAAWASISGSALAAGPVLGGMLVAWLGWRGIFLVNAPVALASLLLLLLRDRMPAASRRAGEVDVLGQVAVFVTIAALTVGLIRAGVVGWTSSEVMLELLAAVAGATAAVAVERRAEVPAVPPALLRAPVVAGALLGGFVAGGVFAGELFVTTLQLQDGRGLQPLATGIAFLPLTLPMVVNPPFASRLVARLGPVRPVLAGLVLVALAGLVLALASSGAAYLAVGAGLLLLGCGMSLTLPALTAAVVLAAPEGSGSTAGGLFSVVRQTGAALGVAAAAAVLGRESGTPGTAHAVMAIAALVGAGAWWVATRPVWQRRLRAAG